MAKVKKEDLFNIIDAKTFKSNLFHLKVQGAYVQAPVPSIVGLDDDEVLFSSDASALYPTITVLGNISPETLFARAYDPKTIKNLMVLLNRVFEMKKTTPLETIKQQVLPSFKNAFIVLFKEYAKHHTVKNKTEALEFSIKYYTALLNKIISFNGTLDEIFNPTTDETYYLLRSYFYPLIEAISWLSPQNKGYNQMIIDYIFNEDIYYNKYSDGIYYFENYNSVKLKFKKVNPYEFKEKIFNNFVGTPYGSFYYKHKDKLAFEVQEIINGLADRRIVKNKMLVLNAINSNLTEEVKKYLFSIFKNGIKFLDREIANTILDMIHDKEDRESRLQSLTTIDFENRKFNTFDELFKYLKTYEEQLDGFQNAIKVTLNSGYGILGLITFDFSDVICANSITTTGKIYGIKLFQAVSVWVSNLYDAKLEQANLETMNFTSEYWVDLKLNKQGA